VLRDDFGPASDVDVLIVLTPGQILTPEKYLDMRDELSAMFGGREIDLVQKRLLKNPFRRREILTTREVLYAA
jgi:predicted nucleotidyltransferase